MKAIRTKAAIVTSTARLAVAVMLALSTTAQAQTSSNVIQDTFTGTTAQLPWKAFNGACLTAGNNQSGSSGGYIPSCAAIQPSGKYYNGQALIGLGSGSADTAGNGALRLTNSFSQNGAIIDTQPYNSNLGIQVTFTTYTYGGNSGGTAKDGADGIGFYLLGATSLNNVANTLNGAAAVPSIGSWGGSLGYSCSNANDPYEGMAGAYMGLGIDEYGNFLNSPDNTGSGDQATSINGGNGAQYQPGRIGLRAYGNVNLATLQALNPSATKSDVQNTCKNGGTYSWTSQTTSYNLTYTYQPDSSVTTQVETDSSIDSITSNTWTSAIRNSDGSSRSTSNCGAASSAATVPTTTTGGIVPGSATPVAYTGQLYQMNVTQQAPVTGQSTAQTGVTITQDFGGNSGHKYTCTGTANANVTTTTTETDYSFTPQGATNTSPSSSNSSGYTGTGQMYGLVNGQYVPVTFNSASQTTTNSNTATLPDYAAIPNAFVNLPAGNPIANESAKQRTAATPISYKLQITQAGLLSLWYSYNGGTYNPVLTGQSISKGNAPMPATLLFGFGGSTGGSSNVHEITCFQVTPADTSASSAGLNVQSGQVKTGTQVYLASYHVNNWWGQLTSQYLVASNGVVSISSTANWDASCVLTGGACNATGGTNTAQGPSSRVMMSWQDTTVSKSTSNAGIQLAWANLTATEQGWLNDDGNGQNRLAYLMGDRSNEVPATGSVSPQIFRDRNSVLGDIIDSSPVWVGPPSAPYPDTWSDKLYPSQTPAENGSTGTKYSAFATSAATRLNVVYDGANDGFLHGFRTGSYDANGNYKNTTATPNDGLEVLAYMPQAVLQTIHSSTPAMDFSSPKYAHNYFVDATPGTGDIYYNNAWHTWLVSGLGVGGNAIFALDITDPTRFTNTNAANIVRGEWSSATLSCVGDAAGSPCGNNLGNTTGTPQIRRLHNGEWGVIFGNGLSSSTGTAGIFVMTFTSAGALDKVYFLNTGIGSASNPNGIAYVTPVDMDGDHITDYVYAGDMYGNVWRFDLTSSTPASWAVSTYGQTSATPLFTTPTITTTTVTPSSGSATTTTRTAIVTLANQPTTVNGTTTSKNSSGTTTTVITNQPITTQLTVLAVSQTSNGQPRVMVEFGTGAVTPQTATSDVQYAPGQQALYGIWDWYMGQSGTAGAAYGGLISSAPGSISLSKLQAQSVTGTYSASQSGIGQGARTISNKNVCYVGMTCQTTDSSGNVTMAAGTMLGWYMNLPGYNGVTGVGGSNQTEQLIYSPIETDGAFIVNTVVPANNSPLTCTTQTAAGWTMAFNPTTGGSFQQSFFSDSSGNFVNINGSPISGIALNATGSPSVVRANGLPYLVSQTVNSAGAVNRINPPGLGQAKRLTWLQVH